MSFSKKSSTTSLNRPPPPSLLSPRGSSTFSRSSTTSLSLHFPPPYNPTTITSFSTYLSNHPFLSSLSIAAEDPGGDHLIIAVSSSCPKLLHLRFLSSPVSPFPLYTFSTNCTHLCSISITISRPLSFNWLSCVKSLKTLSLIFSNPSTENTNFEIKDSTFDMELNLESLSLCGIISGDYELRYIWKNCKEIKKLQLKSWQSLRDYSSFSGSINSLNNLQELELRNCRSIIDWVLLKLAENCVSLDSLVIYDGCSRESLLHFITHSKCNLRNLDLRLPLDLHNTHLFALAENLNFRGLLRLKLQSCLVSGEGLKATGCSINGLEELALINCDAVERESGLLATLGQDFKRLRKLDLSYNDTLMYKELVSMLVSCNCLQELKLRGCNKLSNFVVGSMVRSCKKLQHVDITYCCEIEMEGVEFFVMNLPRLRRVEVEWVKVSDVARTWAMNKFVEVVP